MITSDTIFHTEGTSPRVAATDIGSHARALGARWDAQQTAYIRHRAERFRTIARVAAATCAETSAPRILDLAGGTGSLATTVLAGMPQARAVVADKDPALLAIAADIASTGERFDIAEVDLATETWWEHPLIAQAPFDAVVSSTALHWLQPDTLVNVYRRLATLVRPGGIVLNGDHLAYDMHDEPALAAIAAADDDAMQRASFGGGIDTWDEWWNAVAETPRYASAMARRAEVWGPELHVAPPKVSVGYHLEALRIAGFAQTGTVWQYLDDHVLYAVR